ncbi:hypothetical protein AB0L53_31635 [Nonomuraea sp. NPDC052129]|uniref:hypothetical protein n=1 Tax=Nonomuraea sp. NPDC052129 TaxID=3154651 RepID=UPI00343FE911
MTITINGDDITVNCCSPTPVPAQSVLRREDLVKLSCATVLPEQINGAAALDRQMVCAKAILPAGKTITHLGVPVASGPRGVPSGESRLAVYSITGGLIAETGNDAKLFDGTGWRFSPLAAPLPAKPEDRVIWLTALLPAYSVAPPALLAAKNPVTDFPNLYNPNGFRTFTHPDRTQLPTDVGGDYPPLNMVVCIVGVDLSVNQQ